MIDPQRGGFEPSWNDELAGPAVDPASFACDVNVLPYASDSSSPVHQPARSLPKEAAAGDDLSAWRGRP